MANLLDSTLEQLHHGGGNTWAKRAQAKCRTVPLAVRLASLKTPLEKSYRNASYCASVIREKNGKRTTKYCGQRCCVQCNYHKRVRAIGKYAHIIDERQDLYHVTLTIPSVSASDLRCAFDSMLEKLRSVQRSMRETHKCPLRAIRFIECTANDGQYHPHYHLIVEGKDAAELLVILWLDRNPAADLYAQDIEPFIPRTARNLLSYLTKYIPDAAKDASLEELDVIFTAFKGRRLLQSMGFKASAGPNNAMSDIQESTSSPIDGNSEPTEWHWLQPAADWMRRETGEYLTEQEPRIPRLEPVEEQVNAEQRSTSLRNTRLRAMRKQHIIHQDRRKRHGQTTNHG